MLIIQTRRLHVAFVPETGLPIICQDILPIKPWHHAHMCKLPGTQAIPPNQWLMRDDVYDQQVAYAEGLIATKRDQVVVTEPKADIAAAELLEQVVAWCALDKDYHHQGNHITRPDGVTVDLASDHPLVIARRLVQEDLLIHLQGDEEYYLAAGVLAFPASWSLPEKAGRGLVSVHDPVDQYDAGIARRVGRLFDGLQVGRPIMRANMLLYHTSDLFSPATEASRRDLKLPENFVRIERQCLMRLPVSRAVIFSIHTFVQPISALTDEDIAAIKAHSGDVC